MLRPPRGTRSWRAILRFSKDGDYYNQVRRVPHYQKKLLASLISFRSLGDAKTLVLHPASTTHEHFSAKDRAEAGVTDDMIRLSVGIEQIKDIKADFKQALEQLQRVDNFRAPNLGKILLQDEINKHLYGPSAYGAN